MSKHNKFITKFDEEKVNNFLKTILLKDKNHLDKRKKTDEQYYGIEVQNIDDARALCKLFSDLNLKHEDRMPYTIKRGRKVICNTKITAHYYSNSLSKYRRMIYYPIEGTVKSNYVYDGLKPKERKDIISYEKFLNKSYNYFFNNK